MPGEEAKSELDRLTDDVITSMGLLTAESQRLQTHLISARENHRNALSAYKDLQECLDLAMEALELPLLFHAGGPPDVKRWNEIIGNTEMTTRVMCDYIRLIRATIEDKLG
jgi:hypothetical protein